MATMVLSKVGAAGLSAIALNFVLLLRHAGLNRGLVVFILNLVEGRRLERQRTGRIERVRGTEIGSRGECGIGGAEGHGSGSDQVAHE